MALGILGVAVAVALGSYGLSRLAALREDTASPLARVPRDAVMVAAFEVPAVTQSALWRALTAEPAEAEDPELARDLDAGCGRDLVDQVDELIVFAGGTPEEPFRRIGVLAHGPVARGLDARNRLVQCVERHVAHDAPGVRRTQVDGEAAIASSDGRSFAAFVGRDGVVGGDRESVAGALRVARERAPSADDDANLGRLWARVGRDRAAVAVLRLPDRWRRWLARGGANLGGADLSDLGEVRAVGVGLDLSHGVGVAAVADTGGVDAAPLVVRSLQTAIENVQRSPLVRVSVLGRLLRRIELEAQGREVIVVATVREREVRTLLTLWRDLSRLGRPRTPAVERSTPAATSDAHDPTSDDQDPTSDDQDPTSENQDLASENQGLASERQDPTSETQDPTSDDRTPREEPAP